MNPISRRPAIVRLAPVILFLGLTISVSGCYQIRLEDHIIGDLVETPTPFVVSLPSGAAHDLAIMGIDFDPPLKYELIAATGKLQLLVAVENAGTQVEYNVAVEARLVGGQENDVLLRGTRLVDVLAPGEVKIVRFENLSVPPLRDSYTLVINLPLVPGETNAGNNQRAYHFQLVNATPSP